jgi:hypothetical protein
MDANALHLSVSLFFSFFFREFEFSVTRVTFGGKDSAAPFAPVIARHLFFSKSLFSSARILGKRAWFSEQR